MLFMVNGVDDNASMAATTTTTAAANDRYTACSSPSSSGTGSTDNTQAEERSIPVQVLVKHEEYAAAFAAEEHSGDESSSSVGPTSSPHASSKRPREKRSTKSKCPPGLRSGKWTVEEEQFTNLLIHYFKRGLLHVEDGTSLRWYLAKRLNCEAMRVTKKLKGNSSIGKQIFRALEPTKETLRAIEQANEELAVVENAFLDSLLAMGQTSSLSGAHAITAAAAAIARRKSSPHKPSLPSLHPPHLEAHKCIVPKDKSTFINSDDAKLLLHFFENTSQDEKTTISSPSMEKKRLFSDIKSSRSDSGSSSGSDDGDSAPPIKRQHRESVL